VTTAQRLGKLLGHAYIQDAGLVCRYVISRHPAGAPVTERAIPAVLFSMDEAVQVAHL
jgi:DNA polymerase epsilon subunit 1